MIHLQALAGSLGSMARLGSRCQLRDPWARLQEWRRSSEADRLRQVSALAFHSGPHLTSTMPHPWATLSPGMWTHDG